MLKSGLNDDGCAGRSHWVSLRLDDLYRVFVKLYLM